MKLTVNSAVAIPVKRTISAWRTGLQREDFESTATTWGELKKELVGKGFNFTNVDVTEGNTQIGLVHDAAILPTNIQRRGETTNDLIIIMTTNKNIKSGMKNYVNVPYKELKTEIKDLCNNVDKSLATRAKNHFGNYTQMSTTTMQVKLSLWHKAVDGIPEVPEIVSKPVASKILTKSSRKAKKEVVTPEEKAKIQEDLENGNYANVPANPVETLEQELVNKLAEIQKQYNEALEYIFVGAKLLQNIVFDTFKRDLPTDDELEEMARKFKN